MPPNSAAGKGQPTEVALVHSSCSGLAVRLSTDRRLLLRAIKLGFTEVLVFKPDVPLMCRDDRRTYVWMALDKETVIAPSPASLPIRSAEDKSPAESTPTERRAASMPVPTHRNHASDNGNQTEPSADRGGSSLDLIEEAEALRAMLQEASARSARLIAALKQQRRQSRAVKAAMASLRQLQIDR